MPSPRALPFALALGLLTFTTAALADVPGPRPVCEVEGLGCEQCWQAYGTEPQQQSTFDQCASGLKAKGLVEGCRQRQGAGDAVYFCPPGVTPDKTVKGGGCAGCNVGTGAVTGGFAAAALAAALLAFRRRKPTSK